MANGSIRSTKRGSKRGSIVSPGSHAFHAGFPYFSEEAKDAAEAVNDAAEPHAGCIVTDFGTVLALGVLFANFNGFVALLNVSPPGRLLLSTGVLVL